MVSSVGGMVYIDFRDASQPVVEKIDFDFQQAGYDLCIIDSGANHVDLTDAYAAITRELKALCGFFRKECLCQIPETDFMAALPALRGKVSDRAILRAIHVYRENERVIAQAEALKRNELDVFLRLVT